MVTGHGDQVFPWARLMQIGLGLLQQPPSVFWAMTPREIKAAACFYREPGRGAPAMPRPAFDELMTRFPDQ